MYHKMNKKGAENILFNGICLRYELEMSAMYLW